MIDGYVLRKKNVDAYVYSIQKLIVSSDNRKCGQFTILLTLYFF